MKRVLLMLLCLTLLFSVSTITWAGEDTFYLGGFSLFEYEHSITKDTSLCLGVTPLFASINGDSISLLGASLEYKKYFDSTEAQNGFYIGGFGMLVTVHAKFSSLSDDPELDTDARLSAFLVGVLGGYKLNFDNGFTLDYGIGLQIATLSMDPAFEEKWDLNNFYILPAGRMALGYSW